MAALCVRCKKNQAVLFVSRMENGEMKSEGYCLKCAKELGMKPIDDVLNNLGLKAVTTAPSSAVPAASESPCSA